MSGAPIGLPAGGGSLTSGATGANASASAASAKNGPGAGQSAGSASGFEAYLASDAAKQGFGGRGDRGHEGDKQRLDAAIAAGMLPAFVPITHELSGKAAAACAPGATGAAAENGAFPGSPAPGAALDVGSFAAAQTAASVARGEVPADGSGVPADDATAVAGAATSLIVDPAAALTAPPGTPGSVAAQPGAHPAGATGATPASDAAAIAGSAKPPLPSPAAPYAFGATMQAASHAPSVRANSTPAQPSAASTPGQPGAAPPASDPATSAQSAAAAAVSGASSPAGATGAAAALAPATENMAAARGVRGARGPTPSRDGLRTSGAGTNIASANHGARSRGTAGGAEGGESGSQGSPGDAQSFGKRDVSPDGTTLAGLAPAPSSDGTAGSVKTLATAGATVTDPTAGALQGHVAGDRLRDALASVQNHAVLRNAATGEIDVPELGRVAVRAHTVSGSVDVDITVDRPDARAALHQHAGAMTADLRDADVRVGRMTIDAAHGAGKSGDSPLSDGSGAMSSNRQNGGSSRDPSHDADDTTPHEPEPQAQPAGRVRIVL